LLDKQRPDKKLNSKQPRLKQLLTRLILLPNLREIKKKLLNNKENSLKSKMQSKLKMKEKLQKQPSGMAKKSTDLRMSLD